MVTFTIKIAHKGHRKSSSEVNKPISKKVYGIIKEDANGICCCLVKCKLKDDSTINDVLPFTSDSYELKGRIIVFTKEKRCNVYIRDETTAKFNNNPDKYTTVRKNWLCIGWVMLDKGKRCFRLHEVVKPFTNYNKDTELLNNGIINK